ncbi:ABC transporter permease [Cohnella phaseoli]|uniref:Putative aldouronate transport system permease protein n=1 Tax=Cohnella phaseoli TaxID=456490 RepID=A0A3D9KMZ8_9BACL|nr:ABC transporter permease subunit [Cohnella phaseoli]RED87691.1 putative aldouronate transport system permease protein [Cohnella phaseoli]
MDIKRGMRRELPFHLMVWPGLLAVLIFSYAPMAGIVIAFEKFIPSKGIFASKWIGWDNFRFLFEQPDFAQIIRNTVVIAVAKIIAGLIASIGFALLLNELGRAFVKRAIQTLVYLPHFLSWIILGGILIDILSPSTGVVSWALGLIGIDVPFFLGSSSWFPFTLVLSDVWKEFGFGAIVYLAALTSIDPTHYEAAVIDGANRWRQTWHVTLPGIAPIVVLMVTLSLGNVLNAGFDQVFILLNPSVMDTGDIIDTWVYRMGLVNAQYGLATAVGLFKSVISTVLIVSSFILASKFANYRVF